MRLKVSYEGMKADPEDIVVVRPKYVISAFEAKALYDSAKQAFPDHHVVVLLPDYSIKTYDKEKFLAFLESLRKMVERSTEE